MGMVQLLCEARADPNLPNRAGCAAIHAAVNSGKKELVELLVHFNGDVQLADTRRWRPLHYAAAAKDASVVQCLLDNGADPDARSYHGCTPRELGHDAEAAEASQQSSKQGSGKASRRPSQRKTTLPLSARGQVRPGRAPKLHTVYRAVDTSSVVTSSSPTRTMLSAQEARQLISTGLSIQSNSSSCEDPL